MAEPYWQRYQNTQMGISPISLDSALARAVAPWHTQLSPAASSLGDNAESQSRLLGEAAAGLSP